MSNRVNDGLIDLLRTEIESAHAEVDALRSSLRYRLGDTMLQTLPLSFRSFRVIPKLLALLLTHRRNLRASSQAQTSGVVAALPKEALQCSQVVFNPSLASSLVVGNVWQTNDETLLLARLEVATLTSLELHAVTEPIARRLARLHWQGCGIECCIQKADPLVQYAQGFVATSLTGDGH